MILTKPIKGLAIADITQGFHKDHKALDIVKRQATNSGLPMCAMEQSVVMGITGEEPITDSTSPFLRGYGIKLKGIETGREYLYWHCQPYFPVWGGDTVKRGQIVAFMGNSGYVMVNGQYVQIADRDNLVDGKFSLETKGTHLHLEVYENGIQVDPIPLINWNWEPNYGYWALLSAIMVVLKKMATVTK